MITIEAKIVQVGAKNLLFRKCSVCLHKVIRITKNELVTGEEQFYCEKCKQRVEEFKIDYRLNLVVQEMMNCKIENVILYNDTVETLMGCSALEFSNYLKQDSDLIRRIENHIVGWYCTLKLHDGKKDVRPGYKKCISIEFEHDIKVVDNLNHLIKSIEFDPHLT